MTSFNKKEKNLCRDTESCHFIPYSPQGNNKMVPPLGHNLFLANSSQFIISHFYYHATLCILSCWHRRYRSRKQYYGIIFQKTVCLRCFLWGISGNFKLFRLISSFEWITVFFFVFYERPRLKYRYHLQVDFTTMRKGDLSVLPPGRALWNWTSVSVYRLGTLLPSVLRRHNHCRCENVSL